jgi:quercetin dioxygenase-like cupin family protein
MTYTRRNMCLMLAALTVPAEAGADEKTLASKAFPYAVMTPRKNGDNQFRPILSGGLHDGGYLEVHQTRLAPGGMPHPPHHHIHEEMFLVREGVLEATISGKSTRLGPGSAAFVGSNDEHGIRNAGTGPAEYFVVAFGKDA